MAGASRAVAERAGQRGWTDLQLYIEHAISASPPDGPALGQLLTTVRRATTPTR